MVASRKDLADAIQSYSDNDNHPEKMGNRQQQTNPADVAAFPKIKFSLHPKAQMGESDSLSDASGLTISDNQSTKLGINSSELQCVPVAFPVIIGSFLRPTQTC